MQIKDQKLLGGKGGSPDRNTKPMITSNVFSCYVKDGAVSQNHCQTAKLQNEFGFINDFHVSLSRLQVWVDQGAVSWEAREVISAWHITHAQEVLWSALHHAESVLSRCLPWCTECERRGLSTIRRRLHHSIKLKVE